MSPNKSRMIVSDEDEDSFKNRRSSLRINLSYCTNLSDSGNGSLGRTQVENDERRMDKLQINKRLSRSKRSSISNRTSGTTSEKSKCAGDDVSKLSLQVKDGIQLKHLTINLEDINAKEQVLATNCKRLKDAILNKTQEIFNKQDELSVKTAMVLANQEDYSVNNTHSLNADKSINQHFENKEFVICNRYNDTANNQEENEYLNIDTTPKNGEKQRNSENAVDRSKLTPKRLFTKKDKKQECRIIEDIILDKHFPRFSLKQVDQSSSPILSGSNRRLQLLRSRSKLFSQNQSKDHNNTRLTVYPDHSINIGQPVTCSTFIEVNAKDKEEENKNLYDEASQQGDIDVSQCTHTINTLISMEMTEVHGGIHLIGKHSSLPSRDSCNSNTNIKKKKCHNKSMEKSKNMSVQRLENISNPLNKLTLQNNSVSSGIANNQNVIAVCTNTTVVPIQSAPIEEITLTAKTHNVLQAQKQNNQIKKQNRRQCRLSLSDSNSIRSSLNVNTSLDIVSETSKEKTVNKSGDYGIIFTNQHFEIANSKESMILDNQRQSINTNRTSLQVNTSMDSMCKTWRKNSDCYNEQFSTENQNNRSSTNHSPAAKDTEVNDIDSLENISLIERLRNISTHNQVSHNNKLEIPETENKGRMGDVGFNNAISAKFQNANNNSRNSHSYVEGTPYPISRSVLFKRQLKHKTQDSDSSTTSCNNDSTTVNNEKNNSRATLNDLNPISISDKTHVSIETSRKIENDTVVLEDTLEYNPFIIQEKTTVIEDTLNKTGLETNEGNTVVLQNAENVSTRKGKKRLMPLHENSQLCSIELLEEHSDISEKSMIMKRNKKKLKKKRSKKKTEDSKDDANNIKNNIAYEQVSLDDDCDIFENKKKENKTKKPRKIVSKKIVIKKFANENALRIMEESRRNKEGLSMENRDSSNDFVAHRIIPTQWNKYKSQKIVIVTTGLSKGDKSLVKSVVKSLGMAEMELNVSKRTTHVVSTGVRTVNLLRAIIRGCWLITLEWVLKSLEGNVWLNPEEFEMKHFSKAVLENRKDRQLFGPSYIPELFTTCGLIHVEHKTMMPCDMLKELIKTAGGHITENPKLARITVGSNGLKETWVIDSITTGELQLTKFYQRK